MSKNRDIISNPQLYSAFPGYGRLLSHLQGCDGKLLEDGDASNHEDVVYVVGHVVHVVLLHGGLDLTQAVGLDVPDSAMA